MKKLFLAGVAALFLATGAAHGGSDKPEPKPSWVIDCRKAEIQYNGGDDDNARGGILTLKDVREIEKLAPYLKKCDAFWECVRRRGTKWPSGKYEGLWVYPPEGSKLSPEQPDGTQSVQAPKKRPKHCYPPRWPNGTPLNT